MKVITTNCIFTQQNWQNVVEKCGGWNKTHGRQNENINMIKCPFYTKRAKYYSQSGEEGIIEEIFSRIGFKNKYCIELGANDGIGISNTFYFKEKYDFRRLLIEGNKNINIDSRCKGEKLHYELVTSKNINTILEDAPYDFDFLSIDIDGDDFWVLKAMNKHPRVVILEYHPGLPNDVPLVCKEGSGTVESHEGGGWNLRNSEMHNPSLRILNGYYGANMLAYNRLMNEKGYDFVTSISDNLIYVSSDEFSALGIERIGEQKALNEFFCPNRYWGEMHRDMYNNEWIIWD